MDRYVLWDALYREDFTLISWNIGGGWGCAWNQLQCIQKAAKLLGKLFVESSNPCTGTDTG